MFVNFVKKISLISAIVCLLIGVSGCGKDASEVEKLAKCLAEKNVTMYGAYWCGHCSSQKKMFGDSFQYINYVECADTENGGAETCIKEGIEGLPTWILGDGTKLVGARRLPELAESAGCEYNE